MPLVTACPAARTMVASATGRYGSRSGQRDHHGIMPTAAAASRPYPSRATAGTGALTSTNRAASRASGVLRSSARNSRIWSRIWRSLRGAPSAPSASATSAVCAT
jgi:hypothetical protein